MTVIPLNPTADAIANYIYVLEAGDQNVRVKKVNAGDLRANGGHVLFDSRDRVWQTMKRKLGRRAHLGKPIIEINGEECSLLDYVNQHLDRCALADKDGGFMKFALLVNFAFTHNNFSVVNRTNASVGYFGRSDDRLYLPFRTLVRVRVKGGMVMGAADESEPLELE